jgi:DTW domain-containing protein YfiP
VLALGGDLPAAQAQEHYFETFRRQYIACKPHMVLREQTPD